MQIHKHSTVIALVSVLCCFISCGHKHHVVTKGFYYWKTVYKPTAYELNTLKQLQVNKMYIRLFDVDWDYAAKQAVPVAPVRFPEHSDTQFNYVPVIFITQRTLTNTTTTSLPALASNLISLVSDMCRNSGITPAEVQIDFDWTAGTRDIYFQLLKAIRLQDFMKGKTLSCTIRLHQVKYLSSSGIPPVDKGLLMCYNMGDMKKLAAANSILDVSAAKEYLGDLPGYPLHLDIALPLFSWCLLFEKEQMKGILRSVQPENILNNSLFEHKKDNLYSCRKDTLWEGYELKANDIIRIESPSLEDISSIATYTASRIKNSDVNVVFFHCDSLTLSKFSTNDLEKVYAIFE